MDAIGQEYIGFRDTVSEWSVDIIEHLPTLRKYAEDCKHVTACGIKKVSSAYAFADALKHKEGSQLVLVDLDYNDKIEKLLNDCDAAKVEAIYYQINNLDCPTDETDLLFIDTWHVYGQLKRELDYWNASVKKYILMHDTTVDAEHGETVRVGWDAAQQSRKSGIPVEEITRGIWPAIEEFLAAHPEWELEARYKHNNGLTILRRCTV
jgi:hypothetical protein